MAAAALAMLISVSAATVSAHAQDKPRDGRFREALAIYEKGLYSRARALFNDMDDDQARAWSVLCSIHMDEPGYEKQLEAVENRIPHCGLLPKMYLRHALNLFDKGRYAEALEYFNEVLEKQVPKKERTEFLYKSAYSRLRTGQTRSAMDIFTRIDAMPVNDYTAPSQYAAAYILYENEQFAEALPWFGKAASDPRFEDVAGYFELECRFMLKDYAFVTAHGADLYDRVPEARKPHLARMISEAFLIRGDSESAMQFYERAGKDALNERSDYFYAGSLMYATGDYRGAIENYSKMTERRDSIGQVADYNMGYAYISTKNKVGALGAFRDAAEHDHDPRITEDAFFNYAKLAFDLNNDNSVFNEYMAKYSDKVKGDAIYSYMALSSLHDKDYAAAIAAYDNIDELDSDMKSNYMKANYLRAEQLISGESWRNAVPCLRAAVYLSDRFSFFNQLSRYWLAEAYYRNGQYPLARNLYTELYNASALDGKPEGKRIPYALAYCFFKEKNYDMAAKWFGQYLNTGGAENRRDAMVRSADCSFARRDYPDAADAYAAVVSEFGPGDDLYPYYQAGVSYGLAGKADRQVEVLSGIVRADENAAYYSESWYALGRAYLDCGETGKAEDCFLRLVGRDSDPEYVSLSLLDLGSICRNRGEYDRSLAYYKQVVARMPESSYSRDALSAIEVLYQSKGEPDSYIAYLDSMGGSGAGADIDREEVLFNAAEQLYIAENWQRAIVSLDNYMQGYPLGRHVSQAAFYLAEAYRAIGGREQALSYYARVLAGEDPSFKELSALNSGRISYELESFSDAADAYSELIGMTSVAQYRHAGHVGLMNASFMEKSYGAALSSARTVLADELSTDTERLDASLISAKSLLSMSDRDAALEAFASIAGRTKTPQGAEAAYMLIQDSSDRGEFKEVEDRVYALADSGCDQNYWLAKAFLLLGDSFVEREDYEQARATFESVRDGYTAAGTDDDVPDNVALRLRKLTEMGK